MVAACFYKTTSYVSTVFPYTIGSPYWSVVGNKQVRNRWLVAYTLLRNPSLQELTARRIKDKKALEMDLIEKEPEVEAAASSWPL